MSDIIQTAERILGRRISEEDGLPDSELQKAEITLSIQLPFMLREFYRNLGRNELFLNGFQHVYHPHELEIKDKILIFMAENQGVVLWGIKLDDLNNADPLVYQVNPDDTTEIYSEEKNLSDFWQIILYYQAAQGGYPYSGQLRKYQNVLSDIENHWEKVIEDEGLHVWWDDGKIVFRLDMNDDFYDFLIASARTEDKMKELVDTYGFETYQI
jgi:hypothetical protein